MNLPPAGSSLHFFAMNEIRLFVSGYQRHFWISARHATEALFRALDKELHVELFRSGFCARTLRTDIPSVLSRRIAALTRRSSAVSKKRRRSSRTTGV